jgi:hypothetical protein
MYSQSKDRLESKSVKNSIVTNIARDFNLAPIWAEAYFNQIKSYFLEHADINLSSGRRYTTLLLMTGSRLVNLLSLAVKFPSCLLFTILPKISRSTQNSD